MILTIINEHGRKKNVYLCRDELGKEHWVDFHRFIIDDFPKGTEVTVAGLSVVLEKPIGFTEPPE